MRYEVAGESMAPSLEPGDFLVVDRRAYLHARPRRGDVVLAHDPREQERALVKRVAAVGPHGAVELLGDNPGASTDSRHFGPVDPSFIDGRVAWRYWPLARFGPVGRR